METNHKINQQAKRRKTAGFTLIELLVAVLVTSLLLTMAFEILGNIRETWMRAESNSDFHREIRPAISLLTDDIHHAMCLNGATDPNRDPSGLDRTVRFRVNDSYDGTAQTTNSEAIFFTIKAAAAQGTPTGGTPNNGDLCHVAYYVNANHELIRKEMGSGDVFTTAGMATGNLATPTATTGAAGGDEALVCQNAIAFLVMPLRSTGTAGAIEYDPTATGGSSTVEAVDVVLAVVNAQTAKRLTASNGWNAYRTGYNAWLTSGNSKTNATRAEYERNVLTYRARINISNQ